MSDPDLPLRSDDDLLRIVRELLDADGDGTRTTWVLLLDDDARPLPAVIPITGMPADPDPEDVLRFAETLRAIARAADARQLVVVWERPGPGAVRMQEADWAEALAAQDLPLRAQLLATDEGVRLLDPAFEAIVAV